MSSPPFISYAQNREDVVLHRALGHMSGGRYVEVGANDPIADSVTYAFYELGWSGIAVEPVPAFADRLRQIRPRDLVIEAAITALPVDTITLHQIADTGLSTVVDDVGQLHTEAGLDVRDVMVPAARLDDVLDSAGWAETDIHLLLIDTEGSEKSVLESLDLARWRPWVMVVEATRPNSTEPTFESWEEIVLSAGYRFCLFDGLSRFYVSAEHWDDLHEALSTPANVLDAYKPYPQMMTEQEVSRLRAVADDLAAERDRILAESEHRDSDASAALELQESAVTARDQQIDELNKKIGLNVNHIQVVEAELEAARAELTAIKRTLSWRMTKPLRRARTLSRKRAS